jgi:antitoxin (DNA-binding transcriptional repressor) of toxin-antitoxin stability system
MTSTATIRDLRNRFSRVKRLVEAEGEVLVTDRGRPRYRLTLHAPAGARKAPTPKDYVARLKRFQPRPLGARAANALDEQNRGER